MFRRKWLEGIPRNCEQANLGNPPRSVKLGIHAPGYRIDFPAASRYFGTAQSLKCFCSNETGPASNGCPARKPDQRWMIKVNVKDFGRNANLHPPRNRAVGLETG
jgi:hypothetical protein